MDMRFGDLRFKGREEGVKERYTRIVIELDVARVNEELAITGDMIAVASCTGDGSTTFFKLNHRHARPIHPTEVLEVGAPNGFNRIYMSNAAESGKSVVLYVSGAMFLKTAAGKVGIKNTSGTDIDPATIQSIESLEERFESHTYKHKEETTQGAAGTAERLMAASTPVRWAIIHFQTVAVVGDADTTVNAGAHPGQRYGADSYLAIEFCDLYDIWIMDQAGVAVKYTINYVEEA